MNGVFRELMKSRRKESSGWKESSGSKESNGSGEKGMRKRRSLSGKRQITRRFGLYSLELGALNISDHSLRQTKRIARCKTLDRVTRRLYSMTLIVIDPPEEVVDQAANKETHQPEIYLGQMTILLASKSNYWIWPSRFAKCGIWRRSCCCRR